MTKKIYVSVFRETRFGKQISMSVAERMDIEMHLEKINIEPIWFEDTGHYDLDIEADFSDVTSIIN